MVPIISILAAYLRAKPTDSYKLTTTPALEQHLHHLRQALTTKDHKLISAAIDPILLDLFTTSWEPATGQNLQDPVMRWIALSMINNKGAFKPAPSCTQTLARLTYIIRLVICHRVRQLVLDLQGHRIQSDDVAFASLAKWTTEGEESTFNSIRSLQHLASAIVYATMGEIRIWWTDHKHHTEMLYHGEKVTLDGLRAMARSIMHAQKTSFERLFEGMKLQCKYNTIHDDSSNHKVGYCYLDHPCNREIFGDQDRMLNAVLITPQVCAKFVTGFQEDGTIIWNQRYCKEWLHHYTEFQAQQVLSIEVLGRAASRISELGASNLRNTLTCDKRSCLILDKHVTLMRYYTKLTAIEGHDKAIPTSLPAHTADLMIQDHAILRPFALQLAAVVMKSSPDCVRRYRDCLFVNYDSDFEAKTITTLMGRHSRKEETLGWPMNVNAYRHINVAFRRHHCQPIEHLMESDNEDTIGALQAGHTAKVAREHYAISNEIIEGRIAEEVLPLYLDYSGDFQ